MSKLWRCLEDLRGLVAVPAGWRARLDGDFEAVRGAFLRARPDFAGAVPCAECEQGHEVVWHDSGRIVGVCPPEATCSDIPLTKDDVVLWELNWSRLGRAIAKALGCEATEAAFAVPGLLQVGSFGSDGLPVVLCIQHEPGELRAALAELGLRLQRPFALLAPTGRLMDAHCHTMIASARAGFFDLESNLTVTAGGGLVAARRADELFAALACAKGNELASGEAARVFQLMKLLEMEPTKHKAPLITVFRLLVLEGRPQRQAAACCNCAESLITARVATLEERFKMSIDRLRSYASALVEMEATVRGDKLRKKKGGRPDSSDRPEPAAADGDGPDREPDRWEALKEEDDPWDLKSV